jgi:hypothetical protein
LAAHVVQRPVGAWPRGDYLVAIACASGWLGWEADILDRCENQEICNSQTLRQNLQQSKNAGKYSLKASEVRY